MGRNKSGSRVRAMLDLDQAVLMAIDLACGAKGMSRSVYVQDVLKNELGPELEAVERLYGKKVGGSDDKPPKAKKP